MSRWQRLDHPRARFNLRLFLFAPCDALVLQRRIWLAIRAARRNIR